MMQSARYPLSERHLAAAVRAAMREGNWDLVRVIGEIMAPPEETPAPSTKGDAKSDAQRAAEYRARKRDGVTATVTNRHVTRDVTGCDASGHAPSDSPSSSESVSDSSSSDFSSPEDGSDLEQGGRAVPAETGPVTLFPNETEAKPKRKRHRFAETQCPASDATDDMVQSWCVEWSIDYAHRSFRKFLNHHRSKETWRRDWKATWATWLENDRDWGRPARAGLQPNDPAAPWMKDDHGRW